MVYKEPVLDFLNPFALLSIKDTPLIDRQSPSLVAERVLSTRAAIVQNTAVNGSLAS